VPNTGHGGAPSDASGTQIAANVDLYDSLTGWVNDGTTPAQSLTATAVRAGATVASKPICRYPNYPAYNGSGDLHDASSYSCAAPADADASGQQVQVEVPQAVPGELVWAVDGTSTLIDLGVATEEGDHFAAAGSLNPIRVTDTRNGCPEWSISASVSSFNAGGKSFGGDYLGWTPFVIDDAGDAQAGPEVLSRWFGGEGLTTASVLAYECIADNEYDEYAIWQTVGG
jgi:hypothetical protein